MVQLSHPLLSVALHPPAAALHDAVGEQRRVGVMGGARGGGHAAHVTRAGGAACAAGGAAFGGRQVMLDDFGGRDGRCEVGGESCVARGDGVAVDWDEALVGLRHRHGGPGGDLSHLAWRGHGGGRVQVPSWGGGEARVAQVTDGAGAQRGGLGGGVTSAATRGRAGAGMGGALPGPQAGVDVLEARAPRRPLLPAFSHQAVKPARAETGAIRVVGSTLVPGVQKPQPTWGGSPLGRAAAASSSPSPSLPG